MVIKNFESDEWKKNFCTPTIQDTSLNVQKIKMTITKCGLLVYNIATYRFYGK